MDVLELSAGQKLAFFLDFDGTLTPIVSHPEDAHLSEEMRETVHRLAARYPVAVISGRDLAELKELVKIEALYYAGSHGLEISGPEGLYMEVVAPSASLDAIEQQLKEVLVEGGQIERKRYSIAVHYRNVPEREQAGFQKLVEKIGAGYQDLKWIYGKKVLELRPSIAWDKGKAVLWLCNHLHLQGHFIVYIGDDLTDEDAFEAIDGRGVGIVVAEEKRPTRARYFLKDPLEVQRFLDGSLDA